MSFVGVLAPFLNDLPTRGGRLAGSREVAA